MANIEADPRRMFLAEPVLAVVRRAVRLPTAVASREEDRVPGLAMPEMGRPVDVLGRLLAVFRGAPAVVARIAVPGFKVVVAIT